MKGQLKKQTDKISLWTLDNFASPKECQELMDLANSKGYQGSEVQSIKNTDADPSTGPGAMKTEARSSKTSFVGDAPICDVFTKKASDTLKELGIDTTHTEIEGLQVQRYRPGQKYNPHYDTFENKESTQQRWWTVMVYLNKDDTLEGGETFFPKIDLRVKPKQGRAVIWNNLDPSYCRDINTLHMGSEVTKGEKYIVTIWVRKPPGKKYLCKNKESFKTDFGTIEESVATDYTFYVIFGLLGFLLLMCLTYFYCY